MSTTKTYQARFLAIYQLQELRTFPNEEILSTSHKFITVDSQSNTLRSQGTDCPIQRTIKIKGGIKLNLLRIVFHNVPKTKAKGIKT